MNASPLLADQEEKFCRDYVRRPVGKSAAEFAGYDPSDLAETAYRLLAREDIQDRIAALRHEMAWRQCHDSDAVLAKLQAVYELALEKEQYSSAMRAVALQARIAVLVDDRGRGTQQRRERAVTWAWNGKPTAVEVPPMSIDAKESQPFELPAGQPPHPALNPLLGRFSLPGGAASKGVWQGHLRPLSTPGGGEGWGKAGASTRRRDEPVTINANDCQRSETCYGSDTQECDVRDAFQDMTGSISSG